MPRTGRPPEVGVPRTESLEIRLTPFERTMIKSTAELEGTTASEVARRLLLQWVERTQRRWERERQEKPKKKR